MNPQHKLNVSICPSYHILYLTWKGSDLFMMKWILLILPAFAAACSSNYDACHCYNSDTVPNNSATQLVCDGKQGKIRLNTKEYPDAKPGYKECIPADENSLWWNNCDWRRLCQQAGATGADSSCHWY